LNTVDEFTESDFPRRKNGDGEGGYINNCNFDTFLQ